MSKRDKQKTHRTQARGKCSKDPAAFLSIFSTSSDDGENPRDRKPTEEEWQGMHRIGSFTVRGHKFRKGNSAEICWSDVEGRTPWVAHIVSIRIRPSSRYPWVYIRWWYNKNHIIEEFKLNEGGSVNGVKLLSERELVYSDRIDLLSYRVFEKVVHVVEWHEAGIDHHITSETFFTRSRLLWGESDCQKRPIFHAQKGGYDFAPGSTACLRGSCYQPYDPFLPPELFGVSQLALQQLKFTKAQSFGDQGVALQADHMHFCSRPDCRRWFHRFCLAHQDLYVEPEGAHIKGSRNIRRIAVDPFVQPQEGNPLFIKYIWPQAASGKMSKADLSEFTLMDLLERDCGRKLCLPASVVRVASMPIIRRANLEGVYRVSGNMDDVLLARNLLHQELEFSRAQFEEQADELFKYYGHESWTGDDRVRQYVEELLGANRILASPLTRYWDHIEKVYDQTYGTDFSDLFCPTCRAPI